MLASVADNVLQMMDERSESAESRAQRAANTTSEASPPAVEHIEPPKREAKRVRRKSSTASCQTDERLESVKSRAQRDCQTYERSESAESRAQRAAKKTNEASPPKVEHSKPPTRQAKRVRRPSSTSSRQKEKRSESAESRAQRVVKQTSD